MDFSKLKGKIFFENKFINSKKANIHVLNHSLHFATSVFEGIRVYSRKPLFLDEHLERLINSAKIMKLNLGFKKKKIISIVYKIIKINKINNGYVRPIIFRSSHSMSPDTKNCKSILSIAAWNWGRLFAKKDGVSLMVSTYPKLNKNIFPTDAKSSGSYQTAVIEKINANKKKFDDCLMLDINKNVAESTACNVFWIKKNTMYTPSESSILKGITRKAIIQICKNKKINLKIGNYKLDHIMNSDCIFLTGTAAEIQKVNKINHKNFRKKSKIYELILSEYEKIKDNSLDHTRKI